jgi:hypothetical protein
VAGGAKPPSASSPRGGKGALAAGGETFLLRGVCANGANLLRWAVAAGEEGRKPAQNELKFQPHQSFRATGGAGFGRISGRWNVSLARLLPRICVGPFLCQIPKTDDYFLGRDDIRNLLKITLLQLIQLRNFWIGTDPTNVLMRRLQHCEKMPSQMRSFASLVHLTRHTYNSLLKTYVHAVRLLDGMNKS